MRLLSILLGIGGITILILANALNLSIGWIGLVMLLLGAGGGLLIALVEGNRGNEIGSYLMPRTIGHTKNTGEQREETNMR